MSTPVSTLSLINQLPTDHHTTRSIDAAARGALWQRALDATEAAVRSKMLDKLSAVPLNVATRQSPFRPTLSPDAS